jgi:protein-L-isoaspartate(D-aspartate) O-methyltransferase
LPVPALSESGRYRRRLVRELESQAALSDNGVREAMLRVPRELFVPEVAEHQGLAAVYADAAIPTRWDAAGRPISSSSQPQIMAIMLEHLDVQPGDRVLEVGTGTGYNAALLSCLVSGRARGGRVTSVDIERSLASTAARALHDNGYRVRVRTGDGRLGWVADAPFDRIIVTAGAVTVPREWWEQLRTGGRLVLPLRMRPDLMSSQAVAVLERTDDGFRSLAVVPGGFMPLRGEGESGMGGPSLMAHQIGGAVPSHTLATLSGPGVARLGPRRARRLLASALEPPRVRPLGWVARGGTSLNVFVGLYGPPGRVVDYFRHEFLAAAERATGLVSARGGLAVVVARGTARMESFGDPAAEEQLAALVTNWRARGMPGVEKISVRVRYPSTSGSGSAVSVRYPKVDGSGRPAPGPNPLAVPPVSTYRRR